MNLVGQQVVGSCLPRRATGDEAGRTETLAISGWYPLIRTAVEFTFAFVLLTLTGPLMLLGMALVKLTSRGPALYSQVRVGRGGRPFTIYKIRTMIQQSESLTGACWSKPGDSRITPVGRWLRRTHIDELPQLWNVLRGDMSLIGPRPERPEFVPQLEQAIPLYRARLGVRPGLSGFAQVQLPPDTDLESVRLKLAYDLFYLRHAGWWLDLRICLATAFEMVGVPFSLLRKIFGFAARATVEQQYRALTAAIGSQNGTADSEACLKLPPELELAHDRAG